MPLPRGSHGRRFEPFNPFRIVVAADGEGIVMHLQGDLDTAVVPTLEEAIRSCRETGCGTLILDLEGVTFIGVSALRALAQQRAELTAAGITMRMQAVPSAVSRLLRAVDPGRRLTREGIALGTFRQVGFSADMPGAHPKPKPRQRPPNGPQRAHGFRTSAGRCGLRGIDPEDTVN